MSEYGNQSLEEAEKLAETQGKNLKPARNIRATTPRVCGSCKDWFMAEGFGFCARDKGFQCDAGDLTQWFTTCDLWRENK